ncbi:MAG: RNA polymerase sigma factor [Bacteroidales bacterium]
MDANDFEKNMLPLSGKLYRFACLLLRDKNEAEDAIQEVYLKLWKIRDSLESLKSIEAFAMKMTKNWCLDRIKARKPVYIESYQKWYDKRTEDDDPHRILENTDKLGLLHRILDQLPEQQRHIVQLRELDGLEFEEISEVMDMQVNAVRVNLSRARNRIKEVMQKYESDGYKSNPTTVGKLL